MPKPRGTGDGPYRPWRRSNKLARASPVVQLWRCAAYCPCEASHFGPPLKPRWPVLTRSVSRRLGSVAFVRAAASPNEVRRLLSKHTTHGRPALAPIPQGRGAMPVSLAIYLSLPPRGGG